MSLQKITTDIAIISNIKGQKVGAIINYYYNFILFGSMFHHFHNT